MTVTPPISPYSANRRRLRLHSRPQPDVRVRARHVGAEGSRQARRGRGRLEHAVGQAGSPRPIRGPSRLQTRTLPRCYAARLEQEPRNSAPWTRVVRSERLATQLSCPFVASVLVGSISRGAALIASVGSRERLVDAAPSRRTATGAWPRGTMVAARRRLGMPPRRQSVRT